MDFNGPEQEGEEDQVNMATSSISSCKGMSEVRITLQNKYVKLRMSSKPTSYYVMRAMQMAEKRLKKNNEGNDLSISSKSESES